MEKINNKKIADDNGEKQIIVEFKNFNLFYEKNHALCDINLTVRRGDYLGVIGPNGGGKTTLMKSILGFVKPTSGYVKIYGNDKQDKSFIGYVPQNSQFDRNFPITVEEAVLMGRIKKGLRPFFHYSKEDKAMTEEIMEKLKIINLKKRLLNGLSGGEFQKMLIARALVSCPELLLLDEPTASIDVASRDIIYELLNELHERITVILVTHDMLAVTSNVEKIACLNKTLIYYGKPDLSVGLMDKLYGYPMDLITHGESRGA